MDNFTASCSGWQTACEHVIHSWSIQDNDCMGEVVRVADQPASLCSSHPVAAPHCLLPSLSLVETLRSPANCITSGSVAPPPLVCTSHCWSAGEPSGWRLCCCALYFCCVLTILAPNASVLATQGGRDRRLPPRLPFPSPSPPSLKLSPTLRLPSPLPPPPCPPQVSPRERIITLDATAMLSPALLSSLLSPNRPQPAVGSTAAAAVRAAARRAGGSSGSSVPVEGVALLLTLQLLVFLCAVCNVVSITPPPGQQGLEGSWHSPWGKGSS